MEIEEYIDYLEDIEETLHHYNRPVPYKVDENGTIYLKNDSLEAIKDCYDLETPEEERKLLKALGEVNKEVFYLPTFKGFYDFINDYGSEIIDDIIDDYFSMYGRDPWEKTVDLIDVFRRTYTDYGISHINYKIVSDEEFNKIKTNLKKFKWLK